MAVDSFITNPLNKTRAVVDPEGSLHVASIEPNTPEIGEQSRFRYYAEFLGSTGAGSGTTSMNVDGSVTAQEFYIEATADYDIRLTKLILLLVDGSIAYNKFGAIAALANGFQLSLVESGVTTGIINSATTTGEIITSAGEAREFVTLANFNAGNDNAFILEIDIEKAVPRGVRIGRGTKDKIIATVQDDLTTLADFTICAMGYRHYPMEGD